MPNYYHLPLSYDSKKIYEIFGENTSLIIRGCTSQEIKEISSIINLPFPIRSILYFQLPPNFTGSIHKDIDLDNPYINPNYAINLPISNCSETQMYWFKQRDNIVESVLPGPSMGGRTPKLNHTDGVRIDTLNCNSPTLVEIDNWHSISNVSSSMTSRIISVRLFLQVKKEKALESLDPKALSSI